MSAPVTPPSQRATAPMGRSPSEHSGSRQPSFVGSPAFPEPAYGDVPLDALFRKGQRKGQGKGKAGGKGGKQTGKGSGADTPFRAAPTAGNNKDKVCDWCHVKGHISRECRKRERGEPRKLSGGNIHARSQEESWVWHWFYFRCCRYCQ